MRTFKIFDLIGLLILLLQSCHEPSNKSAKSEESLIDSNVQNSGSSKQADHLNLPDSIHIIGTIIDDAPGQCGTLCFGGSIKVKLENTVANYNNIYAYVVTACPSFGRKTGLKIDVYASKLKSSDRECYYINFIKIDSSGAPYFKLSENETDKIP